jgi:hypothetical protein
MPSAKKGARPSKTTSRARTARRKPVPRKRPTTVGGLPADFNRTLSRLTRDLERAIRAKARKAASSRAQAPGQAGPQQEELERLQRQTDALLEEFRRVSQPSNKVAQAWDKIIGTQLRSAAFLMRECCDGVTMCI